MRKKILVVDDDELIRYGLQRALQAEKIEVITAGTSTEAVLQLSSCRYDLSLIDVHLPDFNGMLLLRIIKDICPEMRVIMMSASHLNNQDLEAEVERAQAGGACKFISKPFNLHELKEVVLQALHGSDEFQTGFHYCDNRFLNRRVRKKNRKPFEEELRYAINVIEGGGERRLLLQARGVDISEYGMGIVTEYPLRPSQVISLQYSNLNRIGTVVWSSLCDDQQTCRAGLHFA
ncbi:response regulator [Desulfurivibrio alkaliphilus]|uniref:Response regulator receiver protein n=1 Tax=Desulfurivibrio alkaliphilus (strain DSM 19089 / UNIQEM U267 / AHT2) TaxID=589865 RepID=D6YZV7_DESAT|nr:response regulator [Desulfurivibrio alkaliphilus]ADH85114.1 response regulator receiver protein [Desulfurivibrio alkaliphilus AHT 2]